MNELMIGLPRVAGLGFQDDAPPMLDAREPSNDEPTPAGEGKADAGVIPVEVEPPDASAAEAAAAAGAVAATGAGALDRVPD